MLIVKFSFQFVLFFLLVTFNCITSLNFTSNNFIVVFKDSINKLQRTNHRNYITSLSTVVVTHEYAFGTFYGYAAKINDVNTLVSIRERFDVAYVEKDIPLTIKGRQFDAQCITQKDVPSWGIARTSELKLPLDGTYTYTDGIGSNVDVYIMDTGVRVTHHEFQGRASFGFNAGGGNIDTDHDGHGTHVAGTVAAQHYGICKKCNIISVKVFTDAGASSASIIIKGFEWIMNHFNKSKINVINISVGGSPGETSDAMDTAVNILVAAGVHVIGAAGNENVDACTESPPRAKDIIAVGSTMLLLETTDYFLGGSNYGDCVKIFAPGNKILSLGINSDNDVGVMESGTSMASPHVAGTLAKLASLNPSASLPDVQRMLFNHALDGVISGVPRGTVNKLVHKACP